MAKPVEPKDRRIMVSITLPVWLVERMAVDERVTNRSKAVEEALCAHLWYSRPGDAPEAEEGRTEW